MRQLFIILLLLLATPVWAEEEKVLSIDDFVGNYTTHHSTNNENINLSISKKNDDITIYDSIMIKRTVTCKFDKATSEKIYLDCYDSNARYDFFKYPYIIIYPKQNELEVELLRSGKEEYNKHNCDKKDCNIFNWKYTKLKGE